MRNSTKCLTWQENHLNYLNTFTHPTPDKQPAVTLEKQFDTLKSKYEQLRIKLNENKKAVWLIQKDT